MKIQNQEIDAPKVTSVFAQWKRGIGGALYLQYENGDVKLFHSKDRDETTAFFKIAEELGEFIDNHPMNFRRLLEEENG